MQLIRSDKGKTHVIDSYQGPFTSIGEGYYKRTLCNKYIRRENIVVKVEPDLDKPTCKICLQILKVNELDATQG